MSALIVAGEEEAAAAKRHSDLIAAFNRHLVRTGEIAPDHARSLGGEASRRLFAAYEGGAIDSQAAGAAIEHATRFATAVRDRAAGRSG